MINPKRNLITSDQFEQWFLQQTYEVKIKIRAKLKLLLDCGPFLGRPDVDSVYGSIHSNMKELRISYKNQAIRIFFAFDPLRNVYICCGGMKGDKRFYTSMIKKADSILTHYLKTI